MREKDVKGYMLVDHNGYIEAVSPGMIFLFNISMKEVAAQKNVDFYFNNIFKDKDFYIE